jgi:hypothetical protein
VSVYVCVELVDDINLALERSIDSHTHTHTHTCIHTHVHRKHVLYIYIYILYINIQKLTYIYDKVPQGEVGGFRVRFKGSGSRLNGG